MSEKKNRKNTDYSWQFLCSKNDHTEDNFRIISLEEVIKTDNTLNDLSDMPPGICAEREKVGMKWIPFKLKE